MRPAPFAALALSLALALACGGGGAGGGSSATPSTPAPASPPPAPPPPAPVAPAPVAPAPAPAAVAPPPAPAPVGPFQCCDHGKANSVLDAYLDLQRALARDDNRIAGGELSALQGNADSAKKAAGMNAESVELLTRIRTHAHNALLAQDIKTRREEFKQVSAAMIPFVKAHKGGSTTVVEAWCPMAEAGWIQAPGTIANPYYGSEMLTCGSFK